MATDGGAALPNPRYISAAGERTERGHQIEKAFGAFQKMLGNKSAIGDYLEGIYEDIYEGKVPESDIDGLIARDFLRFVATAPDEEREVRFFFWYADFFHILDRYQEAYDAFQLGVDRAEQQGLDLTAILSDTRISKGHLLLHLNDLAGAKEAFIESSRNREISPFAQAKSLFGPARRNCSAGILPRRMPRHGLPRHWNSAGRRSRPEGSGCPGTPGRYPAEDRDGPPASRDDWMRRRPVMRRRSRSTATG